MIYSLHSLEEGQRFLFVNLFVSVSSIVEATVVENVNDYVKLQYTNANFQWVKVEDWNKEYKIVKLLDTKKSKREVG